jgi:hypothetical protein
MALLRGATFQKETQALCSEFPVCKSS